MSLRHFVLGVAALGFLAGPVAAQSGRPGRAMPSTPPILSQIQLRSPPMSTPLRVQPAVPLGAQLDWNQTGWSALTQGQAAGAPSVVRLQNGETWLIVRAEDSQLYGASINPAQPGIIASGAWRAFGVAARSEPDCQPVEQATLTDGFEWRQRLVCGYLASGGGAEAALLTTGTGSILTLALGGQNAGARPSILPRVLGNTLPHTNGSSISWAAAGNAVVWDGANSTYRGSFVMGTSTGASPNQVPSWQQNTSVGGPVGCGRLAGSATAPTPCAWAAETGIVVRANPEFTGAAQLVSGVPGGTDRRSAPAVVVTASNRVVIAVRNSSGRIYWAVRPSSGGAFGAWQDAGGTSRSGTGLSCIGQGEAVSCFIQGWDGRLFGRVIGNTAGL